MKWNKLATKVLLTWDSNDIWATKLPLVIKYVPGFVLFHPIHIINHVYTSIGNIFTRPLTFIFPLT